LHLARPKALQARWPKKLEKSRFFAVRSDTPRYALERIFSNSGSSAHSGRGGSSPPSRTTFWPQIERFGADFYISENFFDKFIFRRFSLIFDKGPISNVFLTLF
jgi:hypothetical protein